MCCIRLERCRSTAGVAAAGILPEGGWVLGAVKLVCRQAQQRGLLGVDLRAVECFVRCVFVYILSWLELDAAGAGCWCGFAARY